MRERINDSARLELMSEAIDNIEEYLTDVKTYEEFALNKLIRHAVAYNLQCIGENAYKLSREFVAMNKEIDWQAIEGLRHVLVHDYFTVNFETVWNIIKMDVPDLKGFLAEYVG